MFIFNTEKFQISLYELKIQTIIILFGLIKKLFILQALNVLFLSLAFLVMQTEPITFL